MENVVTACVLMFTACVINCYVISIILWCGLASHGMASLTIYGHFYLKSKRILVIGWYQLIVQCWTLLPVIYELLV